MTYDFNGYEQSKIRRGSPDDIARDGIEDTVIDEGCDLSQTSRREDVDTKIFTSSGGIDLVKVARNV